MKSYSKWSCHKSSSEHNSRISKPLVTFISFHQSLISIFCYSAKQFSNCLVAIGSYFAEIMPHRKKDLLSCLNPLVNCFINGNGTKSLSLIQANPPQSEKNLYVGEWNKLMVVDCLVWFYYYYSFTSLSGCCFQLRFFTLLI